MAEVKEEERVPRVSLLGTARDSPWGQRDSFRDRADPLPALPPTALHLGRVMQEKGLVGSCSGAEPPCPCPTAAPE